MSDNSNKSQAYQYDVCLSFAGEDREYVQSVADTLRSVGIRVFYDQYEKVNLWGKDLYQHLDYVYNRSARFCVVFVSADYAKKVWTNHEIKSAQARAFQDRSEYLLPARFDDTDIPGIRSTTGFIDLRNMPANECADLIQEKLRPYRLTEFWDRDKYFPPEPDILWRALKARSAKRKRDIRLVGNAFFKSLTRMDDNERKLVFLTLINGCHHDFPQNMHIEIDLLRRLAGMPASQTLEILSGISSLGFEVEFCDYDHKPSEYPTYVYLRWVSRNAYIRDTYEEDLGYSFCLTVAVFMLRAVTLHYCDDHALEVLMRLNFSSLSSATAVEHKHDPIPD